MRRQRRSLRLSGKQRTPSTAAFHAIPPPRWHTRCTPYACLVTPRSPPLLRSSLYYDTQGASPRIVGPMLHLLFRVRLHRTEAILNSARPGTANTVASAGASHHPQYGGAHVSMSATPQHLHRLQSPLHTDHDMGASTAPRSLASLSPAPFGASTWREDGAIVVSRGERPGPQQSNTGAAAYTTRTVLPPRPSDRAVLGPSWPRHARCLLSRTP